MNLFAVVRGLAPISLLIGPPGAGKTMLAKRLPTILPSLTLAESLETPRNHSVAGELRAGTVTVARAHDKVLRVGRTIADLADADQITAEHVAEAIHYRRLDRQL